MNENSERIIDLGQDRKLDDAAVETLRLLVDMHNEPHRLWRATPSTGGAWNYEKIIQ